MVRSITSVFRAPLLGTRWAMLFIHFIKREKDFVMNDNKNIKNKWLHLRLSEEEYQQLQKAFKKTTERKLSRYARNILLGKPMIAAYHNKSLDELMPMLAKVTKSIGAISNNYNQAVHKLHTLDHTTQVQNWTAAYENGAAPMLETMEETRALIEKITVQWLQS